MEIFNKIKKDELLKGSIILLVMINLFNLFNFIFHFFMARLLTPSEYGILAVLMSLVFVYAIPAEAIQTVISKHSAKLNIKKQFGKIKDLMINTIFNGAIIAFFVFLIFNLICYFFLSEYLQIDFILLFIGNIMIFSFFLFPVIRGILQGRKQFYALGSNMLLESILKLVLAIIFVILGFGVYGAIGGVVFAFIIFFLVSFLFIKKIIQSKREYSGIKKIYSNDIPILIIISGIVLFYSLDIIIAKAVFSPEIAGNYAVLSMIGKMIFFGTYAISKAMFPISIERAETNKSSQDLLLKSLGLVGLICLIALIILGIFPKLVIGILFGNQYMGAANLLFYVAMSFSILSITNIFLLYNLSKGKLKLLGSLGIWGFVMLEIILLNIINTNLFNFILAFLSINILMLMWSLVLFKK